MKIRNIILFLVIIFVLGALLHFSINYLQFHVSSNHLPEKLPLTLKERLWQFMEKEDVVFDYTEGTNNQKLVILWKDLPIKIGDKGNYDQKVFVLRELFPLIVSRYNQIDYIDIRFPENVVIKYNTNSY